jgi:hypothetical protein
MRAICYRGELVIRDARALARASKDEPHAFVSASFETRRRRRAPQDDGALSPDDIRLLAFPGYRHAHAGYCNESQLRNSRPVPVPARKYFPPSSCRPSRVPAMLLMRVRENRKVMMQPAARSQARFRQIRFRQSGCGQRLQCGAQARDGIRRRLKAGHRHRLLANLRVGAGGAP